MALAVAAPSMSQEATTEAADRSPVGIFSEVMDVQVINVDVYVTDRKGQPVVGLSRDAFELRVDGAPVPISNFYAEVGGVVREALGPIRTGGESSFVTVEETAEPTARRTHVVILIDHQRLRPANRKRAFKALREAVARFDKEDLIAVVGVEGSLVFYSDFLYDRRAVERILDNASRVSVRTDVNEFERRQIFGELARGMSGGVLGSELNIADDNILLSRIRAYATEEYARSLNSLREVEKVVSTLNGVPGRKVVLYLGEGIPTRPGEGLFVEWRNRFGQGNPDSEIGVRRFDFNTDYSREIGRYDLTQPMEKLASRANAAGVTLYAVDAEGNHGGDLRSALTEQGATSETLSVVDENYRAPLEYASKATGGRLLRSSGELVEQLADVVSDFDTFYSLGFMPPAGWDPGTEHDIKVEVGGKELRVRHREEVRLPQPDELEAGATVAALIYQTVDNPLGFQATPGDRTQVREAKAGLPVTLEIPVGNLGFVPQGDVQAGSLTIFVTTKNAAGETSQVQKIPFHLNLPAHVFEQAKGDMAHYPLPLVLRPGDQQVAIGIRDDVNGVFSAIRLDVSEFSSF
jgi:VWFA-related protein